MPSICWYLTIPGDFLLLLFVFVGVFFVFFVSFCWFFCNAIANQEGVTCKTAEFLPWSVRQWPKLLAHPQNNPLPGPSPSRVWRHFLSHDVDKEFTRVAHSLLEGLPAPRQLRRNRAQFPHRGSSGGSARPVDFGAQLGEIVEGWDSWRPVRMLAVVASLAVGGRDVASVAELADGPLPTHDAGAAAAAGGVVRLAAAASRLAVLLSAKSSPAVLAVASVRAAAFAS